MAGKLSQEQLDDLSFDAKVVAGGLIGLKTRATFEMRESRPSDRAQAALDELVAKGIVTVERNHRGWITYRPAVFLMLAFQWLGKVVETDPDSLTWPLTTPLSGRAALSQREDDHDR